MEGRHSPVGASWDSSAGTNAAAANGLISPRRPARRVTPGASSRFVAATEWLDDGTPVVSVMGELDLFTAPALDETLLGLADDGRSVMVDLRGCSFIESTSLKVLAAAERRLNRSGRRLALVMSNPCLMRVFEITRLDEFFAIYPSLGLALEGESDG